MPEIFPPGIVDRHGQSPHAVTCDQADSVLSQGEATVHSHHQQAIDSPGTLRIVATAEDGVIEAVDDPGRPFYLGVQWHPERPGGTDDDSGPFGRGLIHRLVEQSRDTP